MDSPRGTADEAARLFIVDLDELTAMRIKAALRRTDLAVEQVASGQLASRLSRTQERTIVLLDWATERAEERRWLCAAVRRVATPGRCRVIAVGGTDDQLALFDAVDGPADDALCRPFDDGALLLATRRALSGMRDRAGAGTPSQALAEALASHRSGEVAIRSEDVTALIHVHEGDIVWAHVSSAPGTIEEVLASGGLALEEESLSAVKEESRRAGKHLLDVMVGWGLVAEEEAREAARLFVADRVQKALDLPSAVALFLPRARALGGRVRFRASDIPCLRRGSDRPEEEQPPLSALRQSPLTRDEISRILELARGLDGSRGAAILDRQTGACLSFAGDLVDSAVTWSHLGTFRALGPTGWDVIATTEEHCFIARPLAHAPSLVLFVAFSLAGLSLGLAKAQIAGIASGAPDRAARLPEWRVAG